MRPFVIPMHLFVIPMRPFVILMRPVVSLMHPLSQAAGADAVSVTIISHDEPEAEAVMGLVESGWDLSGHVFEVPREALSVS